MIRTIAAAALAFAALAPPCHGQSSAPTYAPTAAPTYAPTASPTSGMTIGDLAIAMNEGSGPYGADLDIVIAAIATAGLVETLTGSSIYTVFAPTNEAFEAVNITAINVDQADPVMLKTILLYHTLPGEFTASDVMDSSSLTTVEGEDIQVEGTVLDGDVNIVSANHFATNGVIHIIDGVLIPPSLA